MPHIPAVATIWCLVCSKLLIVQPLFEGGDYLRQHLVKEIRYVTLGDDIEINVQCSLTFIKGV